jgi:hypothetical protein
MTFLLGSSPGAENQRGRTAKPLALYAGGELHRRRDLLYLNLLDQDGGRAEGRCLLGERGRSGRAGRELGERSRQQAIA